MQKLYSTDFHKVRWTGRWHTGKKETIRFWW